MTGSEANAGRLAGKVALITGGTGNIGTVVTRRYLEAGATVVIAGRNADKLTAQREEMIAGGFAAERIVALKMDGSKMSEVRAGIAEVMVQLGRIDVLVNNAGTAGPVRRLAEIPLTPANVQAPDSESLLETVGNVLGISWNLIRAAAPHLRAGSSIINVSTIFSRTDYYGRAAYTVPKAAINALNQGLARELGVRGIRVNTIYPGPVESDRISDMFQAMDQLKGQLEGSTAAEFFQTMRLARPGANGVPVKGFPQTTDIAETVVFLGSDEAAAYSGHIFEVTNGMDIAGESQSMFVSRPGLRIVDASDRTVLVCAGDQAADAVGIADVLQSRRASIVLAFRDEAAITQAKEIYANRRLGGPEAQLPLMVYLNPLEPQTVTAAFSAIEESRGPFHDAIVLPAFGSARMPASLVEVDDNLVARFVDQEIAGTIALASQLARYWSSKPRDWGLADANNVIFLSNGDDGQGNPYNGVVRAGNEQLTRIWRHESTIDTARETGMTDDNPRLKPRIWSNQIIRYTNREANSLDFAAAWALKILTGDRRIDPINLYLPRDVGATTGARRPSFGWAESLFGLHLGKVALITGGSAGIGGQIGRLLALSGGYVVLAARRADQLEAMRNSIVRELLDTGYSNAEARVRILPDSDVADEASLARMVEYTLEAYGRIDYLINNAGIAGAEEMVIDMPLAGWNRTQFANLISNYSLIRKVAPLMKKQGSGYILNVSSYFGGEKYVAIPYPNRSDYAVSKAGQRAMVETFARFMGPEIQFNAIAPGPVEGERLRGTGDRPGLFMRRSRLILENKRLNDLYGALIESYRVTKQPVSDMLPLIFQNQVGGLQKTEGATFEPLRKLADSIVKQGDAEASSTTFLMNETIAQKLLRRLEVGGYLQTESAGLKPDILPPDPFFAEAQVLREAHKVRDGILGMLYLKKMPTEFDVAVATVYYLADRAVTGETFHPSGGLRFERTVTEGELFGKASAYRLEMLRGTTAYLIGEHMRDHIIALTKSFLDEHGLARVVVLTESEKAAQELPSELPEYSGDGRFVAMAVGDDLEGGLDRAMAEYGRPGPVVSMPFHPLPTHVLAAPGDGDWQNVLTEDEFAQLVHDNLTHHFRISQKISLIDNAQLVLVTPETSRRSTDEQFALANFIKTTLHAFTATIGVESERTVHQVPVNQVDLTRRARNEEPRNAEEEEEELSRFVNAVLLTSAPLPDPTASRYRSRIYRGNAITV